MVWSIWQSTSLLGVFLADGIPVQWGLGFAGTLAMLGLTYGLLSDRSTWVAAVVAGTAAVASFALPLKLNILVAIAAAVAAGLMIEQAERAREGAPSYLIDSGDERATCAAQLPLDRRPPRPMHCTRIPCP